jgi:hypothetical protein
VRRRSAGAVLVATVALAAGLSACSDDETAALPAPEDAEKGERVDVDAFVDAIEGSFDDGSSARVSFDVRGPTRLRGRGVVAYDADGMDVDIRITDWQVQGGWINLRTIDGAAYMKVPESRGLWVDIGADDSGLADSVMQEADPRDQIALLREEISEVRFSGDDVVGDAPARRYQVVTEAGESRTEGSAAPDVTEFWFDESGVIRRRSNDLGTGGAEFTWVDWDAAVDIAPPPDDRVITLAELERLRRRTG